MKRAKIKPLPSQARLLSLFKYDRSTGLLSWRKRAGVDRVSIGFNNKCADKAAGTITARGYLTIGIRTDGKLQYFLAQRIIWKLVAGQDPGEFVDHRDGDRLNNRWRNLRAATNGQNIHNSKLRSDNKSGVKGVCWDAYHKKWVAYISVNYRQRRLGRFLRIEYAVKAIEAARAELHGEFSRIE